MTDKDNATLLHLERFIDRVTIAMKEFIKPMNIKESEEMKTYIKDVVASIDNVILVARMSKGNKERERLVAESTEEFIKMLESEKE